MMMRNSIDIGTLSHAIHLLSIMSIIIVMIITITITIFIVTMFIISIIIITITMYHYHHHCISNHQPPPHHHHHHRYLLHRFVTLLSCAVLHIELSECIATLVYRAQIIIIYR